MQNYRQGIKGSVGFVPTMGALHEGHLSLIKASIEQNAYTIVSIYVNPTQFLEGEDLDKYPRTVEKDLQICKDIGVSGVFLPCNLYEKDEVSLNAPNIKGHVLEGHFRPGHFDGVLTVVMKLLNLVDPNRAYFGKKDAQQFILIKQMANNLFLNIKIKAMPTLRDNDGLAKSSRNIYLSNEQRKRALSIYKTLQFIENNIASMNLRDLKDAAVKILEIDSLQYLVFSDHSLNSINSYKKGDTLVTIAGFIGSTRLIDNLWL